MRCCPRSTPGLPSCYALPLFGVVQSRVPVSRSRVAGRAARRAAKTNTSKKLGKQKHMEHLTLTTGHSRISTRSEVADKIIALVQRDLLPLAEFAIPGVSAGWSVKLTRMAAASMFSIYHCGVPIVTCGLAMDARASDLVWRKLMSLHSLSHGCLETLPKDWPIEPSQPRAVPWLGVVLLPMVAIVPSEDLGWLGDFERCLAWGIVEETLKGDAEREGQLAPELKRKKERKKSI